MSPTSSRKIVPPRASSNRPTRSRTAPVNAPFTWPKSSLSRRSGRKRAAVHGDERPRAREGARVERARDDFLAGPALPGDEDGRVAPVERLDEVDDLAHRRRARDEAVRRDHALEEGVLVLGGAHDDEVARPRVAVVRDVERDDGRRERDEAGARRAAAEDGAPPLLAPPVRERLAERVRRAEELRADEVLDRLADHGGDHAGARDLVERVAGPDDPEVRVEDDEGPPSASKTVSRVPNPGPASTSTTGIAGLSIARNYPPGKAPETAPSTAASGALTTLRGP